MPQSVEKQLEEMKSKVGLLQNLFVKFAPKEVVRKLFGIDDEGMRIHVTTFNGYIVTSWRRVIDEVKVSKERGVEENQVVEFVCADGSEGGKKVQLTYSESVHHPGIEKVLLPVEKIALDPKTGEKNFIVKYKEQTYELNQLFVN